MTIVIDGKNAILGRLASFAAKETLKGEDVVIVNCRDIIITGNKKSIEKNFEAKAGRFGHSQKGPKHHKTSEKIVKRTIRGMLPDYRMGRGRTAFKKIKCYENIPKEFENEKMIKAGKEKTEKYSKVGEFTKK